MAPRSDHLKPMFEPHSRWRVRIRRVYSPSPMPTIRRDAFTLFWLLTLPVFTGLCANAAKVVIQFDANQYEPFRYNPDTARELTRMADAIAEFRQVHPQVEVEYITKPAMNPETWLNARLKSGDAPDIVMLQADFCNKRVQYGWFVPLDPYLEQPNPFIPGNTRWLDIFYKDATDARRAPDGRLYVIPYDQVGTAIFYNKDLFARAGIGEGDLPTTWAEFMEIHRRLKAAGIIPFCMTTGFNMRLNWAWRILTDQIYDELLPLIDVRAQTGGGFPGVDDQEFVRAYKKGLIVPEDERFLEYFRIMKEWSQYWQGGHLGTGDDKLFRLGKAAMFWDGSWAIGQLDRDKLRTFEYGIFGVPRLTTETTRFAPGRPPRSVGGATAIQWAVTDSARVRGTLPYVIDLLRILTTPRHAGPIIEEAEMFLPNIKGVRVSSKMRAFESDLEAGHVLFGEHPDVGGGGQLGDRWFRMMQSLLGGNYTLDDVATHMRFVLDEEVERLLQANYGVWRFDANWEILPVDGLCWSDHTAGQIFQADRDGQDATPVCTGALTAALGGIAVDSRRREIYWCDYAAGSIYRASLDGPTRAQVLTGLAGPTDVEVDTRNGKLYWTEWKSGSIGRANLDGSLKEFVLAGSLTDDAFPPDPDARLRESENRQAPNRPWALAVDPYASEVYWSSPADGTIRCTSRTPSPQSGSTRSALTLISGIPVTGIDLDLARGLVLFASGSQVCQANLDGSSPEVLFTTPDRRILHLSLDPTGYVFWAGDHRIARADLRGQNMLTLHTSSTPWGIAFFGPPEPERLPESSMIKGYALFLGVVFLAGLLGTTLRRDPLKTWRRIWNKRSVYLFILPTFALLFSFSYYPIIAALWHAFTEWTGGGQVRWVGMANFVEAFHDPVIWESLGNMLIITVFSVIVGTTAPLLAAELVFNLKSKRWQYWYRVLFVVPMVVPGVVILLVWQLMYDYNLGVFNRLLDLVGLPPVAWLSSPRIALYSILLIGFPFVGGFGMLIYYAGLQNIPRSVIESASLDGASGISRFFYFDLPLVMGQIKLMIVFSVIGAIQGFQTQLIVSAGGPGYSTMVPGLHMYQNAMQFDRMGYACAIGTLLFLLILALTYLNMRYLKSSTEYEAG